MRAIQELRNLLRNSFRREIILAPDVWAETHIRLSSRQSNIAGRYSLAQTPYLRRIYQDVADRKVRTISLAKAAQIGASQFFSNLLLWHIANSCLPAAVVFPSQAMGQQFAERSLHPAIETTEPVRAQKTDDVDDIRRTELIFKTCTVKVIGGGSATKLSSNPIAFLELDEVDKYGDLPEEANPVELAIDRTLTFQKTGDSKVLLASTPTLEHTSIIWAHFLEGSASKYFVPCPHCGHRQELIFAQLKFSHCKEGERYNFDRLAKETFYECEKRQCKIYDSDKPAMLNRGEWVDTNPNAPADARSYHVSGLLSPFLTFGSIARLAIAAGHDRSKLQNFYNSILGLPFVQMKATVTTGTIDELVAASPKYKQGELPAKPLALIMGCDTQQAELPYCVLGLMEGGATAVISYGVAATFEDLDEASKRYYKLPGSEEFMGINRAFIDSGGNRTSAVYEFCLKTGGRFIPCKGWSNKGLGVPVRMSDKVTFKGYQLPLAHVNDGYFTDLLLLSVLKQRHEVMWLPQDTENYFKEQLSAVSIVEKKNAAGFIVTSHASKTQNHMFDCVKYAYALRYMMLPHLEAEEPAPANETDATPEVPEPAPVYVNDW